MHSIRRVGIKKPQNSAGVTFSLVLLTLFVAGLINFRHQLSEPTKFGLPIWVLLGVGIIVSLGLLWGAWFRKRGDF